jgi:hypothetical protein
MRAAIIENGIVTNIVLVDSLAGKIDGASANIGDTWDGATFSTPAPVVTVPRSVSKRQARLALHRAGVLVTINAAFAAMPGDAGIEARIEWEDAGDIERSSPLVGAMGSVLGMTSAQVDALFIAAAGL